MNLAEFLTTISKLQTEFHNQAANLAEFLTTISKLQTEFHNQAANLAEFHICFENSGQSFMILL